MDLRRRRPYESIAGRPRRQCGGGRLVEIRSGLTVTAGEEIPLGHKIALCTIAAGDMVIKYGVPIGRASRDIPQGSHVHTQNVEDITTQLCREYAAAFRKEAGA